MPGMSGKWLRTLWKMEPPSFPLATSRAVVPHARSSPREPAPSAAPLGVPVAEFLAPPPQDPDKNIASPADDELNEKDDRRHAHHGRGNVGGEEGAYIRVRCRQHRKTM